MHTLRTAAVLLLVLATSATLIRAQDITRSFSASSGGTLELRLEAGGSVRVTGGASGVEVQIERSGRDAEDVDISFDQRGERVIITSEYDHRGRHDVDMFYDIRVPSRFNVDLQLTGGDVTIDGISGTFDGQTMGGDLTLSDLSGEVDLQTMGGTITLRGSEVDGKVHTMGGNIRLTDVTGDVQATTMGGDVTYSNVRARGASEMRVRTMGGDISVEDAPAGADVHTMGGDITVGEVGEYLKAETMGGNIEVASVNGWIQAKTMGGDVDITMVGGTRGDRHVEITSMGGDIDLTVPAGLSMRFDIEIGIEGRGNDPSDYVIESDFPLDVDVPGTASRRMRVTAEGSTGGGDNLIRIRTVNGNVRLLRGS